MDTTFIIDSFSAIIYQICETYAHRAPLLYLKNYLCKLSIYIMWL